MTGPGRGPDVQVAERILVSSCLLGERVRFDGRDKHSGSAVLQRWLQEGRIVAVCPEVSGGLPVPRPPAEIERAAGGAAVLAGRARVVDDRGGDVTRCFVAGAERALALVREHRIRVAVLKARSPSCGTGMVYDGTFARRLVDGDGVAAALLRGHGVRVFDEEHLDAADAFLRELAGGTGADRDRS